MLQRKICKLLSGQYLEKEDSIDQNYILSYLPAYTEFENLCLAPMACMSHAFVYDAVNVSKTIVIPSTSYHMCK